MRRTEVPLHATQYRSLHTHARHASESPARSASRREPVRAMAAPAIEAPALERKVALTGGVTCSLCGIGRGMQAVTPRTRATMQQAVTPKGGTFIWAYRPSRPNGSRLSCGRLVRRGKTVGRSPCPARGTTLRFL